MKATKFYGYIGVLIYLFLSLPFFRGVLFSNNLKVLDSFDIQGIDLTKEDTFSVIASTTLIIPKLLENYIFVHFEFSSMNLLVIAIFVPIVYKFFSTAKNASRFFFLLFIFLPTPLLFLSSYNKEVYLVLAVFFAFSNPLAGNIRFFSFCVYSILLRPYLFWVPFALKTKQLLKASGVVAFVVTLLLITPFTNSFVFRFLNRRTYDKSVDANSEISQSVFVESFGEVFLMLFEVLPQFLFPIFYQPGLKSIFLTLYLWTIIGLCILKRNNYSNVMLLLIALYIILDPDLGAFLRHVSSFFLMVPLILGFKGKTNSKKLVKRYDG